MEAVKFYIELFSKWTGVSWEQPICGNENEKLIILIQDCHLLVAHGSKALESLSLMQAQNRTHVFCKSDTMVFEVKFQEIISRFRVKFQSQEEAQKCLEIVERYTSAKGVSKPEPSDITLPQMLTNALKANLKNLKAPESIPEDYPLDAAIQLCILDPGFPVLLRKIEDVMEKILNEETKE